MFTLARELLQFVLDHAFPLQAENEMNRVAMQGLKYERGGAGSKGVGPLSTELVDDAHMHNVLA
jgi:hypothetical protein